MSEFLDALDRVLEELPEAMPRVQTCGGIRKKGRQVVVNTTSFAPSRGFAISSAFSVLLPHVAQGRAMSETTSMVIVRLTAAEAAGSRDEPCRSRVEE